MNFLKGENESYIYKKIHKFIKQNFPMKRNLNDDDSFLEKGIIDSSGVLELVGFIESTFHIEIEDDELVPDNLDSVNKIINFIKNKLEKKSC
jgi:acyl carrier protein